MLTQVDFGRSPGGVTFSHREDFVHVVIENLGEEPISNCNVHIVGLEKQIGGKIKESPKISPPIRLVTAGEHEENVTIYPELPQHFDLASASENKEALDFAPALRRPNIISKDFFNDAAEYLFGIKVTSDHTPTISAVIKIAWENNWDALKVEKINGHR